MFVLIPTTTAHALTQEQLDIVARADYMYNTTWVAQADVEGWVSDEDYCKFYKGQTYRIPYGQPVNSGRYIGYGASVEQFLESTKAANSIFYTQKSEFDGCTSVYYASDCSSFVSYCWGVGKQTTKSIPGIATYCGGVNSSNINNLRVGDALNSTSVGHVVLVTDIKYSGSTITSIEITEQTPPDMERTVHTPSELISKYGSSYSIYRYANSVESGGSSENDPKGNLESVSAGENSVTVKGWAFDVDNTSKSIEIHVYIGGDAGTGEGHAITANVSRPDVNTVYGCGSNHGFQSTISTSKTGTQPVYVYAINVGEGTNTLLGMQTVTISNKADTSSNPISNLEIVSAGENSVRVKGWTFDKDDTSKSLEVHVYVGGGAGAEGVEGHVIKANTSRPDVNTAYGCGSSHGFDSTITTKKVGTQTICVYAINIGSGENVLIGKKSVTITDTTDPVVSNVKVAKSDSKSFTISCTATDKALSKVHMAAWYSSDKANTEKWYNSTISGTTATCTIPISDLGNKEGSYTVHIYAYDTKGNHGFGDITFDFYNPTGTLDYIGDNGGSIKVRGWAFDKNDTSEPIEVHVYIGGDAGTGEGTAITANVSRPDVDKVHGCGTNHGFSATIPTSKVGTQDVYIYLINIGTGGTKLLAKKTVTITADTSRPTINNMKVASYNSDTFKVTADVSDNVKVDRAVFAAWYTDDKTNTIQWFDGTVSNGVASCEINRTDISKKDGSFTVEVYAYDSANNYVKESVEYKHYSPRGSVEVLEGTDNGVNVKGWAYDGNNLSQALDIKVYIGGPIGTGEEHIITADKTRTDIDTSYDCGANHGFETTLKTERTGKQLVYVYATNIDSGSDVLLKISEVTITEPEVIIGNVNSDSILDVNDVTYFQMHLAYYKKDDNSSMLDENNAAVFKAADTNADGMLDINDVTYIQLMIAGIV